ncbi:PLD nuclease N-terminal domain-containing protein [Actinoplanes rectilineatus]|uniref:PLD nuclease N-terminal domain-containing protein n=1 Tax=Actinoplanes rectilineatus TaxID=113571 RepID=UPI0005F2B8AC|nr:PLD nuclease N-terminal domain-containing protein [Actinoplanes rectilineatus]
MVRLFILLAAAALVLLILALISGLAADRVRNLPRALWIVVILLIPIAGPIAYLAWGRPVTRSTPRRAPRPASPDDDPDFLRSMDVDKSRRDGESLSQWERELNRDDEQQQP